MPAPPPPSRSVRWLLFVIVLLVGMILLGRLGEPDGRTAAADTVPPAELPAPAPEPSPPPPPPVARTIPVPGAPPRVETPTLDLLVRLEARRRIQRAGSAVYLDSLLLESDSILRRWPERPGDPVRVGFVRDSLWQAAGIDERAVREAFARWEALRLRVRFAFVADTSSAEIVVGWIDQFAPEQRRTGQTDLEMAADGTIHHARITLSVRDPEGRILDRTGLAATALHEVGHALGLGHSSRQGDIMHALPTSAALSDRDRRTVELIYGLPAGSVKEGN